MTYYNVGKLIVEAQGGEVRAKYGDGLIKEYSKRLTEEFGRGYTTTNLKYMRNLFLFIQKGHALHDQLSWNHYKLLLSISDSAKIDYYINISINQNLSYRKLDEKIKSGEYERLDDNTKNKLINHDDIVVSDFIKNPILIKNIFDYEDISKY